MNKYMHITQEVHQELNTHGNFDQDCATITEELIQLSRWKHRYLGAAYTTRLHQLVTDLQLLAEFVDETIEKDIGGG